MNTLFIDDNGKSYCAEDVLNTLKEVGAHDCDYLFIHSDIIFGNAPADFNRKEYMSILFQVLNDLNVKNIIVPTFTYSFCNNEIYDVKRSKTSMGSLSEYIRKQPDRYRTLDPLLSLSVPSSLKSKFDNISTHSLGADSGLDIVHHLDNVNFLFFGVPMGICFTYLHYIEKMMDIPYRFDMDFEGDLIDYDDVVKKCTQTIHTACYGVKPKDFFHFEDYLEEQGKMKKSRLGNNFIECILEKNAYSEIKKMIEHDINYFLEKPFKSEDLEHRYTKGLDGKRITHC